MDLNKWADDFFSLMDEEKMSGKQKKILIASIEVFAEKGYAASSTSEIAKKAGVAEGTIFRHYKTKKDLLLSIVAPVMAKFMAPLIVKDFHKVFKQEFNSYEEFVRALFHNRITFIKEHLSVVKIMIQEIPFHPELRQHFSRKVMDQVVSRIESIIIPFQEKGELINLPPKSIIRFTATSIMGLLFGRFILFPENDWDLEQAIEETIQMILHGVEGKGD
ncbi:TetR/AcrR family transcriptional regulator [Pseudalkalibacillus salsuginis]|uniref:TetR/AcrR family transcriptional regulator n=1 Tax=Pseudalkalibacillus salsuginis TaxID=2910972 RepID=UPI001F2CEAF5|nr:TetR/AcrR family transcriptional regulator [Pseudalkalibacillus salsuginis]MCF6409319.1 TetR/AcrR family transcriptional regulator [Pseudalkalibacillus salsuginis]